MSDLVKAQNMPQFNWYTCWMSLGADGMPDNLIKEGLKQPNRIKISFEEGAKEITSHVMPNQAWFSAEYFLAYTLPDFKSKILHWLLDTQKDDGPLLFSLLGQCFQNVGLTKWASSIIPKQCPNNADRMKSNFDECISDYLKAVVGFPNIGDQLIRWLCTSKKPALMPMHKFTRLQAASQLPQGWLPCQMMDVPTAQEKSEQIFFAQPKMRQNQFANLNKTVPTDPLKMIAFFEQCQATNKVAGILKKIAKDKKQPKEKKSAYLPATHSRELCYRQHCSCKYCNYHWSNQLLSHIYHNESSLLHLSQGSLRILHGQRVSNQLCSLSTCGWW
jgi:hypothetical protein